MSEPFKQWKACTRKKAYATREEAFQKGQEIYQCRYCGQWHRTAGIKKLLNIVRKSGSSGASPSHGHE